MCPHVVYVKRRAKNLPWYVFVQAILAGAHNNIDPGQTQRGIFREVILFISQRYKLTSAQRYRVKLSRQLSVMNHSLSSTLRPPFSSSVHPSPLTLPSASLNWRLIRKSLCS